MIPALRRLLEEDAVGLKTIWVTAASSRTEWDFFRRSKISCWLHNFLSLAYKHGICGGNLKTKDLGFYSFLRRDSWHLWSPFLSGEHPGQWRESVQGDFSFQCRWGLRIPACAGRPGRFLLTDPWVFYRPLDLGYFLFLISCYAFGLWIKDILIFFFC